VTPYFVITLERAEMRCLSEIGKRLIVVKGCDGGMLSGWS
jgi:hypothetical protein